MKISRWAKFSIVPPLFLRKQDTMICNTSLGRKLAMLLKQLHLQALQGQAFHKKSMSTEDEARLDTKADRFWGTQVKKTYFDIKLFIPF